MHPLSLTCSRDNHRSSPFISAPQNEVAQAWARRPKLFESVSSFFVIASAAGSSGEQQHSSAITPKTYGTAVLLPSLGASAPTLPEVLGAAAVWCRRRRRRSLCPQCRDHAGTIDSLISPLLLKRAEKPCRRWLKRTLPRGTMPNRRERYRGPTHCESSRVLFLMCPPRPCECGVPMVPISVGGA